MPDGDRARRWSHPDAGVDPEDYVEDAAGDGSGAAEEQDPGAAAADQMAPGASVDGGSDAVEPNEPA